MKIILALSFLLTGCASIVSTMTDGHPNRKEIPVPPGSTVITLADGAVADGDKDGIVEVSRGAGAFRANAGRVEKDGYMLAIVQRRVNGWIVGNFLPYNGIIVGLGVDFIGGGAYNPTVVYVSPPEPIKPESK